jgi:hypothetical protein
MKRVWILDGWNMFLLKERAYCYHAPHFTLHASHDECSIIPCMLPTAAICFFEIPNTFLRDLDGLFSVLRLGGILLVVALAAFIGGFV